jgi:hypothetical protein
VPVFGLIGTVTADRIVREKGGLFEGLGGVLYQASVLCGLNEKVRLFSHCGIELETLVEETIRDWPGLDRSGFRYVPGPGNRVELRYSERLKEREEVLRSVVPALDPGLILPRLEGLDALLVVFNSGYDLDLPGWRSIVDHAGCPIWLDTHSLVLDKIIGSHRDYFALPDWRDWISGTTYLQANRQELACLIGRPERWPGEKETEAFAGLAFRAGVRAVFVTMGKEGVLVLTPDGIRTAGAPRADHVVDTTGCGDVFCARALQLIVGGASAFEAAAAGVALASKAAGRAGVRATFEMVRESITTPEAP